MATNGGYEWRRMASMDGHKEDADLEVALVSWLPCASAQIVDFGRSWAFNIPGECFLPPCQVFFCPSPPSLDFFAPPSVGLSSFCSWTSLTTPKSRRALPQLFFRPHPESLFSLLASLSHILRDVPVPRRKTEIVRHHLVMRASWNMFHVPAVHVFFFVATFRVARLTLP